MARERGLVHRLARRVPGSQEAYRRLKIRRALAQKVVRIDHPTLDVRIRVTNAATARLRVESVAKEPWTVAWLERSVRPGDVVWDVGANVGVYALLAARLLGEDGTVVAVEPGYANFAALCDNVVLNELDERVVPLPLVLGEAARLATLDYSDLRAGSALHLLDGSGAQAAYRQPVLVHTVDQVVESFGVDPPTLLKLDVDGGETSVLAGALDVLARPELRSVLVEIETELTADVVSALAAAQLFLVEEVHERDGEPLPGVWYGVFERR
ncbi:MAG: FkbM family methyltransferase [Gaiellaceae bacterium MAG52_C11]|nr:FkbM family methyltransferase [Candidatus Gaiellasilicea maunaloa]